MFDRFTFSAAKAPITSIDKLCEALSVNRKELFDTLDLPNDKKYTETLIPKSHGKVRKVHNPHKNLRKLQRRINRRLFNPKGKADSVVNWPIYIYGSVPNQEIEGNTYNRDYVACARQHCGSRSILKLDISDFFDNVHEDHVKSIFANLLKYSEEVADVLTKLCCYKGSLVQGALTSSFLACLCLYDVEPKLVKKLNRKKLRYTRLVDDITISSTQPHFDFSMVKDIALRQLYEKDLPVNKDKVVELYSGTSPMLVHGLRVNYAEPRLPSEEVSRIRAAVKRIELQAIEPNYLTSHTYRKDFNRTLGRVNKLARMGHNQHKELSARLSAVRPKPSRKDIERCWSMLARLQKDFDSQKSSYWYKRRYHRLSERLIILKRTFFKTEERIREVLKKIKPEFID